MMRKQPLTLLLCHTAAALAAFVAISCNSNKAASSAGDTVAAVPVGPSFSADSAYMYCQAQCAFGPRTMNSAAHDSCGEWIADKFRQYGCGVTLQKAMLTGYDGTQLRGTNIVASYRPELSRRVILCSHWDSRPWADNDNDENNWHKPVLAANDGASGVAVMIEIARLIQHDTLAVGVDFICFDAEDYGAPRWSGSPDHDDAWALGAQYWAAEPHAAGYSARYGILLDMVGGQGARFFQEGYSLQYAKEIVKKVWAAARVVGYGSYFPERAGGIITDDHVPVNQTAGIPTIDIIAYYPDCAQSSFGPTWHTVDDTMENIDRNTLKAVGQTLVQVLYSER